MPELNPIPASRVAAGKVSLSNVTFHNNNVYWCESRPEEKGRTAIKRFSDGEVVDCLPKKFSTHSKVHEYGGAAYTVLGEIIYFSNAKDQQVYKVVAGQEPEQLTKTPHLRFADFRYCESWNCLIAVCEDSEPVEPIIPGEVENYLVAIDCETGHVEPIIKGADFYSSPRISPNGKYLTWIDWVHPNMPWDHTRCWVADIGDVYELDNPVRIAGNEVEAVIQPEWIDAEVRFVSDSSGWWNLCQADVTGEQQKLLCNEQKEFARAPWVFGLTTYANLPNNRIIGFTESDGEHQLYLLDLDGQIKESILPQFNTVESIVAEDDTAYFIAGNSETNMSVWQFDILTQELKQLSEPHTSFDYSITTAKSIIFPTTHNEVAHANLYLPESNSDEKPPLLVKCHGGPSGVALKGLDWKIQYWTSRGFAVLDVNYRGSTGFGREYRNSLYGKWGEHDVDDCLAGIDYLKKENLINPDKIVITGGSAGGYTVLRALIVSDVFAAGTSYYGVADLKTLVGDDHKFESRYLETCIAPFATNPERYDELSPINHVEKISSPMLFFQGLKDKVVQPNQTTGMVDKLKAKGNQVEMVVFPEEAHGFRQAESIITSLDTESEFYKRVFIKNV